MWADAFHVCVRDPSDGDRVVFSSVLASEKHKKKDKKCRKMLSAWQYAIPPEDISYCALYPRAWTTYSIPKLGLELTCRQTSPFIPGNYQVCSCT